MPCKHLESDEFGDICHASCDEECPNPWKCTAEYDAYGNPLKTECTGLDEETYGFY